MELHPFPPNSTFSACWRTNIPSLIPLRTAISDTARHPNGQFVNFDPNWQPSGDTTTDCIYLRDRLTDLYNIEAR